MLKLPITEKLYLANEEQKNTNFIALIHKKKVVGFIYDICII